MTYPKGSYFQNILQLALYEIFLTNHIILIAIRHIYSQRIFHLFKFIYLMKPYLNRSFGR